MTMTYYGTTAATTSQNPPLSLVSVMGGTIPYSGDLSSGAKGGRLWLYSSTNAASDLAVTANVGAITDGRALGMKNGDVLIGVTNGTGGSALSSDATPFIGVLYSSISTAAGFSICSNYTT